MSDGENTECTCSLPARICSLQMECHGRYLLPGPGLDYYRYCVSYTYRGTLGDMIAHESLSIPVDVDSEGYETQKPTELSEFSSLAVSQRTRICTDSCRATTRGETVSNHSTGLFAETSGITRPCHRVVVSPCRLEFTPAWIDGSRGTWRPTVSLTSNPREMDQP